MACFNPSLILAVCRLVLSSDVCVLNAYECMYISRVCDNYLSSFKCAAPVSMAVVPGPATALSWICIASVFTYNCLVGPVNWEFAFVGTKSTTSSAPLPGEGRSAVSTTPVLSTSTRFLQPTLELPSATVSLDLTVVLCFLPASFAQCVGWLAAGLVGVSVGRYSSRAISAVDEPEATPLIAAAKVASPKSPKKIGVGAPSRGGLVTPSTRKLREQSHGKSI